MSSPCVLLYNVQMCVCMCVWVGGGGEVTDTYIQKFFDAEGEKTEVFKADESFF